MLYSESSIQIFLVRGGRCMFKRNEMVYRVQKKKKKNELSIALSCKHNSASLPRHFSRWPVCESCRSRHGYAHSVHHGRAHTVVPAAKTPQTRHVFTTSAFPKDCASRREPLFILLTRLPVKGHVFVFDNGLLLNTPDILDFFFSFLSLYPSSLGIRHVATF